MLVLLSGRNPRFDKTEQRDFGGKFRCRSLVPSSNTNGEGVCGCVVCVGGGGGV